MLVLLLLDKLADARLVPLIRYFRPFGLDFCLSERLLAILHPLDVLQHLLLNDLELVDHFWVLQVDV